MRSFNCEMEQRADALQNAPCGLVGALPRFLQPWELQRTLELSKLIPSLPYTGPSLVS